MSIQDAACLADLAGAARRRLPSFVYNYLDGGAGEDAGVKRNEAAFGRILLRPRRLGPLATRTTVSLFGRSYNYPIGIAPMGLANLFWPDADRVMARLAQHENIPYVLSTAASTSIERIAQVAADVAWYQLYHCSDAKISADMLSRAWAAGLRVLVVTVDVPIGGRRNRSIRDRFTLPIQYTPRLIWDLACHPAWSLRLLRAGRPTLENFSAYSSSGNLEVVRRHVATMMKDAIQLADLVWLRDQWKGALVVKGVMLPEDAQVCLGIGADGIWVSNHGGRQLESAPASIDAVARIRAAVGGRAAVMVDGGVRRGEDVIKACALGADMAICGRGFGYAVAAAGPVGLQKAWEILTQELQVSMSQIGCPDVSELGRHNLVH